MKFAVIVVVLLAGTALGQDADPISLVGGERTVPICHGKNTDATGCVLPPRPTYSPDPSYPEKARKKKQSGAVLLALVVGSDGLTREVKVDRGLNPELNDAAVDAVKRWKFTPASKDGNPVAVQIKVQVSFKLY